MDDVRQKKYKEKSPAFRIAWGGIITALIVFLMFMVRILPTADFALSTLMSAAICLVFIETGWRGALAAFISSGLLGFLLIGLPYVWQFLIYFGPWPFVKALIEGNLSQSKKHSRIWVLLLKIPAFALLGGLAFLLFSAFILPSLRLLADKYPFSMIVVPLIYLIVSLIYDWAITQLITIYSDRVRPHLDKKARSD